jgi:putative endonuclease
MTIDVAKRLRQHNLKQNKSTKAYSPWVLIHQEKFNTRIEAREREKYFKSGIGKEPARRPRAAIAIAEAQMKCRRVH